MLHIPRQDGHVCHVPVHPHVPVYFGTAEKNLKKFETCFVHSLPDDLETKEPLLTADDIRQIYNYTRVLTGT
jgi:hypothetical protein